MGEGGAGREQYLMWVGAAPLWLAEKGSALFQSSVIVWTFSKLSLRSISWSEWNLKF